MSPQGRDTTGDLFERLFRQFLVSLTVGLRFLLGVGRRLLLFGDGESSFQDGPRVIQVSEIMRSVRSRGQPLAASMNARSGVRRRASLLELIIHRIARLQGRFCFGTICAKQFVREMCWANGSDQAGTKTAKAARSIGSSSGAT